MKQIQGTLTDKNHENESREQNEKMEVTKPGSLQGEENKEENEKMEGTNSSSSDEEEDDDAMLRSMEELLEDNDTCGGCKTGHTGEEVPPR